MIEYDPSNRFQVIFSIHGTVMPSVLAYVATLSVWTISLMLIYDHFGTFGFEIGPQAHATVGVALGLMLVFRTNTSYDRFWEGRKQLGSLGIAARNLAIKANAVIPGSEAGIRADIAALLNTFVMDVKDHLREEEDPQKAPLTGELQQLVAQHRNPINGVLCTLSDKLHDCIARKWMHPPEMGSFNASLDELQGVLRALDRIRFTPMPFAYVNQLKVFMLIYFLTLPFVLIPSFGWGTVFAMIFTMYAMVGIEEIGIEIEDPFGDDPNDLPIVKICNGIKQDVDDCLLRAKQGAWEAGESASTVLVKPQPLKPGLAGDCP